MSLGMFVDPKFIAASFMNVVKIKLNLHQMSHGWGDGFWAFFDFRYELLNPHPLPPPELNLLMEDSY